MSVCKKRSSVHPISDSANHPVRGDRPQRLGGSRLPVRQQDLHNPPPSGEERLYSARPVDALRSTATGRERRGAWWVRHRIPGNTSFLKMTWAACIWAPAYVHTNMLCMSVLCFRCVINILMCWSRWSIYKNYKKCINSVALKHGSKPIASHERIHSVLVGAWLRVHTNSKRYNEECLSNVHWIEASYGLAFLIIEKVQCCILISQPHCHNL